MTLVRSPTISGRLLSSASTSFDAASSRRGACDGLICARLACLRPSARWRGCASSVVPQQPPTMLSQPCRMKRSRCAASDCGRLQVLAFGVGQSGVGIAGDAVRAMSVRVRRWSVMNSGPVAQLRPMESRSALAMEAKKASVAARRAWCRCSMVPETIDRDANPELLPRAVRWRSARP